MEQIPGAAPIPRGRRVLLFSGGLDSVVLSKILRVDVMVRFSLGHRYDEKENAAIRQMEANRVLHKPVVFDHRLHLGDVERADALIPMRNLLLATMGSFYGDQLIMAVTNGDANRDKDSRFMADAGELLTYLAGEPRFGAPDRRVTLHSPTSHLTKRELIQMAQQEGVVMSDIIQSVSCYEGGGGVPHCGRCKNCFRRWVALAARGYPYVESYGVKPWTTPVAAELYERALAGHRGKEDADTIRAMRDMRLIEGA